MGMMQVMSAGFKGRVQDSRDLPANLPGLSPHARDGPLVLYGSEPSGHWLLATGNRRALKPFTV